LYIDFVDILYQASVWIMIPTCPDVLYRDALTSCTLCASRVLCGKL